MEFKGCWECGKALPEGRKGSFCEKACATKFNRRRFPKLPPGDRVRIGAAAEMLVAADLLEREKDVLRSLNPQGGFDLAVLADNKTLKIEVKTGHLCENTVLIPDTGYGPERRRGRQESDKARTNRFDILAVALLGQKEVIYNPEPEDWGKKECMLRWRQRSMDYDGKPSRRVMNCEVRDGKLHVEFEEDGMSLEMKLKHFPELAQACDDDVTGVVVRNGYWLRWPRLDFEIDVTDFLRAEPRKVQGRLREGERGPQRDSENAVRVDRPPGV
jgi:hypothetical protein